MDPVPTVSPCRSLDFWFDDGSVVLHVESTQFRVHRSMLSANSEVFRGMFSLPQPATTIDGDLVDGCPVVRLADKVVDWIHVLKALYCGGRFVDIKNFGETGWPFPVVAAYLRLGKKYEIEHLHTEAVGVLSAAFPLTLEEYDSDERIQQFIVFEKSLYFDVISLAREAGMRHFLPAAYYNYCEMFAPDEVLEGITRCDHTISILSVQDQRAVMQGWHTLVQLQASETLSWMRLQLESDAAFFPYCEMRTSRKCALARKDMLCEAVYPNCFALRRWNPAWEMHMCSYCTEICKTTYALARANVWAKLPSVFGLPSWDELLSE